MPSSKFLNMTELFNIDRIGIQIRINSIGIFGPHNRN